MPYRQVLSRYVTYQHYFFFIFLFFLQFSEFVDYMYEKEYVGK